MNPADQKIRRCGTDAAQCAVVDGKELKGAEADRLVKKLYEGALQHPKAAPLWREWHIE